MPTATPAPELADILRARGADYADRHPLTGCQQHALRALVACRTAALGGQRYRCPECGHEEVRYHSCGNRHCPKCQALAKERWLAKQLAEVLPVGYFHVVFTLPHALNGVTPTRGLDALLFDCAARTLLAFAHDPKWLGAEPAITALLHTWDQRLRVHRHVHCLVSGGGLNPEGAWMSTPPGFLFPVHALSRVFRGRFLAALASALDLGEMRLPANLSRGALWAELTRKDWVVYAKPPLAGPTQVLAYLSRYTHRAAIGNARLLGLDEHRVTFLWRDRARGNMTRPMALPIDEFIRRFLNHVLPRGFQRIRHYGLLANRHKARYLVQARHALGASAPEPAAPESVAAFSARVLGVDIQRCPVCHADRWRCIATVPRVRGPP
jgi:hypothetical protein